MKIVQTKEQYTPPRSEELEMTLEGVIAASGGGSLSDDKFEFETW